MLKRNRVVKRIKQMSVGFDREERRSPRDVRLIAGRQLHCCQHFDKSDRGLWTQARRNSASMFKSCYAAVGDTHGRTRVSHIVLSRAENILAQDPNNATAIQYGASALAALEQPGQFKEWMNRALLFDPENIKARFNFACALVGLNDTDAALDMLGTIFDKLAIGLLKHAKADPDLDPLREHPRFKAMVTAAEARLGGTADSGDP